MDRGKRSGRFEGGSEGGPASTAQRGQKWAIRSHTDWGYKYIALQRRCIVTCCGDDAASGYRVGTTSHGCMCGQLCQKFSTCVSLGEV